MVIVGITGTIGAGKGEVVAYLESKGFKHYSARKFLIQELQRRGSTIDRVTMVALADELRRSHSSGYIIEQLYDQAKRNGGDSVIESVRALGEVDFLKKQRGFRLIAIDADPKVRYERIVKRQSELDHIDFAQFRANDAREMAQTDPSSGNIAGCMKKADFLVMNDGSREEFTEKLKEVISKICTPIVRQSSSVGRASLS